jgi:hypothetical protein
VYGGGCCCCSSTPAAAHQSCMLQALCEVQVLQYVHEHIMRRFNCCGCSLSLLPAGPLHEQRTRMRVRRKTQMLSYLTAVVLQLCSSSSSSSSSSSASTWGGVPLHDPCKPAAGC